MITSVEELEKAVFEAMQSYLTASDLQAKIGFIGQTTARNYHKGLVQSIDKENLFKIADALGIAYSITNVRQS